MKINPEIDAAIKDAKPLESAEEKKKWQKVIDGLNKLYCVVQDGSRVRVHSFEKYENHGHVRQVSTLLHFQEFSYLLMNLKVKRKGKVTDAASLWLHSPQRRQYTGIVFEPGGPEIVNGKLNLWRGFGVEPKQGNWSRMKVHMHHVMASDNREHFEYIMNWLAWAVQHPDQQAEVALVFKGKRGTGKGTLGNAMLKIFGQHGVHISDSKHLTGSFNNHLRDACLLFADEAFWPGDKSAEGSLKRLVTEPTLFIEAKRRDGVTVPNLLHVIIASNEDWIIPAGERERRFVKFDVSEVHIQDAAWFGPLYAELKNGGYAAMLYDLLHHDLGSWHPRKLPDDTGLLDQQQQSLQPLDQWICGLLESGTLSGCDQKYFNRAVSNSYEKEVESFGNYSSRPVRQPGLYDQARAMVPKLRNYTSDHTLGAHLRELGCTSCKVGGRRGWEFPVLKKLRHEWEKRFGGWNWTSTDVTGWQPEQFNAMKSIGDLEADVEAAKQALETAKAQADEALHSGRTKF